MGMQTTVKAAYLVRVKYTPVYSVMSEYQKSRHSVKSMTYVVTFSFYMAEIRKG